ncbi:hypothetical protein [Mesorhizobium sp.]|nr:hypothetical protein [Mesorhizobium sp.]
MTTTPLRRHGRFDAAMNFAKAKFRLEKLEECISQIPERSGG